MSSVALRMVFASSSPMSSPDPRASAKAMPPRRPENHSIFW